MPKALSKEVVKKIGDLSRLYLGDARVAELLGIGATVVHNKRNAMRIESALTHKRKAASAAVSAMFDTGASDRDVAKAVGSDVRRIQRLRRLEGKFVGAKEAARRRWAEISDAEMMTAKELSVYWKVHSSTVYKRIEKGSVPATKNRFGQWLIPVDWVDSHRTPRKNKGAGKGG
jgi:excisionase family DNA binding protein